VKIAISLFTGFLLGLGVTYFQNSRSIEEKQQKYDQLSRESDAKYLALERKLAKSGLARDSLNNSLYRLDSLNQVLYKSLNKPVILYREKLQTLNSKELQDLMITEFSKR
jgi:hypothetical protein